MFNRLISLIGEDNFNKVKNKKILLLGAGGVGGYTAESLIRSGVHNLTIIDCDIVDETNLNRQIIALHSTIGLKKTDVLDSRLKDINPDAKIEVIFKKVLSDELEYLHLENYDYVIDCIDDIEVKVSLARYALKNDIRLIISTGTAKKLHPEYLEMTTLDKTSYDPLARKMRTLLKNEKTNKLIVLASKETPIKTHTNTLGSAIFVPASAGLLIASFIFNDIIK